MKPVNQKPQHQMNKFEITALINVVKRREQLLKSMANERASQMMNEFEVQCSSIYNFDDDAIWKKAMKSAEKVVSKANNEIISRCKEMGIPKGFEPSITIDWSNRGQNEAASRRNELRRIARTKVDALKREACSKIERMCLQTETDIISNGLSSPESKALLNGMPDICSMMPSIKANEIKLLLESKTEDY